MSNLPVLTPVLLKILEGMAAGLSAKEIGVKEGKSSETVKQQRQMVLKLWGARNGTHAVVMGMRAGVIR